MKITITVDTDEEASVNEAIRLLEHLVPTSEQVDAAEAKAEKPKDKPKPAEKPKAADKPEPTPKDVKEPEPEQEADEVDPLGDDEPAAEEPAKPKHTREEVRQKIKEYAALESKEAAIAILKDVGGAASLTELSEDKFDAVYAACDA